MSSGENEERCPPIAWHQPRQGGGERPVGPGEPGTGDLTLKYGELVAKHENLGVLGGRVCPMDPKQFGHTADQVIEEAEPVWIAAGQDRGSDSWTLQRPGPRVCCLHR